MVLCHYLYVLSWIVIIPCSIFTLINLWMTIDYNKDNNLERHMDEMRGYRRQYPMQLTFIISILSLSWIITYLIYVK